MTRKPPQNRLTGSGLRLNFRKTDEKVMSPLLSIRRPSTAFLPGVVVGIALGAMLLGALARRMAPPPMTELLPTLASGLPAEVLDTTVLSAAAAKRSRRFFLSRFDFRGIGVKLLETPRLFEDVFPGYGEARTNATLWDRYFAQEFEANGFWVPSLSPSAPERLVSFSWAGCATLYRDYGADIVLVGTSQVFRGIVPAELAKTAGSERKILLCARPFLGPEGVQALSRDIAAAGRHARLLVWGYSLWDTGFDADHDDEAVTERWEHELRDARTPPSALAGHRAELFALLSWDHLLPLTYERARAGLSGAVAPLPEERSLAALKSQPEEVGFWLPADADEATTRSLADAAGPRFPPLEKLAGRRCDLANVAAQLDRTLSQALRSADRVFLFVPPVPPTTARVVPECVREGLAKLLRDRSSERVLVETSTWDRYGLEYRDFVYRFTPDGGVARFDPSHTNLAGARKITARLAARLREARWLP